MGSPFIPDLRVGGIGGILDDIYNGVGSAGADLLGRLGATSGGGGGGIYGDNLPYIPPPAPGIVSSTQPRSGGGGGGGIDVNEVADLMSLGFSYDEALDIASVPGQAAAVIASYTGGGSGSGGGGGGGSGAAARYLLPEESAQMNAQTYGVQLQNQLLERELAANPYLQPIQDSTTGNLLLYNTQTGAVEKVVGKFGYADIDPERSFGEQIRQFDVAEQRLRASDAVAAELGRGNLALATELGRGGLAVDNRRLDLDTELGRGRLALDDRIQTGYLGNDTARVGLEGRRLDLDTELGRGRLSLDTELGRGNLDVNRGQLGVNQGQLRLNERSQIANEKLGNRQQELERSSFVADVLRKPSDFLARAFMQRGGTSPTGMVTQADIINNLKSSINAFSEGGATQEGMFTTGEQGKEAIINPTGAPIIVLNNSDTNRLMEGGDVSGYAGGTMDLFGGEGAIGRLGNVFRNGISYDPNKPGNTQRPATPTQPTWGNGNGSNYQPGNSWNGNVSAQPISQGRIGQDIMGTGAAAGHFAGTNLAGIGTTIGNINTPNVTQEGLAAMARSVLPPGLEAAIHGDGRIPSARPVGNLTLGRLSRLTPDELEAMNSYLGVAYNTTLDNEIALLQERFGPVVSRARGRLIG
jgi:hypothetical protein